MKHPSSTRLGCLFAATALLAACGGGGQEPLPHDLAQTSAAAAARQRPQAVFTPQSGLWWNPQASGSGYTLDLQGNQIVLSVYAYETSGVAAWYAATLTQQSNGSFTGALTRFSGGQTLAGAYKAPTASSVTADATLTFTSATTASLLIRPTDGSAPKTTIIERFSFSTPSLSPSTTNFDNGLWWNENQSGRGFVIEAQGSLVTVAGYMYDSTGQPVWYLAAGSVVGGNSFNGDLQQYANGQSLTGAYRQPNAVTPNPGNVMLVATSRTTANLTLPDGSTVAIKRFIFNSAPPVTVDTTPAAPAPAPAPAPSAPSAAAGKTIYGQICFACHGTNPSANLNRILKGANSPTTILFAIGANIGGMNFLQGTISQQDAENVAAYLAAPN